MEIAQSNPPGMTSNLTVLFILIFDHLAGASTYSYQMIPCAD
jgi:hypothetical protein